MRVSSFSVLDGLSDDPAGVGERYGDFLALAEAGDAAGLECAWVAEHHFHTGGLVPSPPVLLAAAAARTRRLRLGVMVSVLPFHSAVALAEEYSMVDQISGGRLNLGVGSGYLPQEFEGYGVDPATKRERFDRGLEEMQRAFRGEPVRPPGGAEVTINVRPRQQPHPPLWLAVQRREAIVHVARRGLNLALVPYATTEGLAELTEQVAEYRAARADGRPGTVSVALHVYAGEHPQRAREALQRYLDSRRATRSTFFEAKVREHPEQARAESLEAAGWAAIGRPDEVVQRLAPLARAGVDELLGIFDFGGVPREEVVGSVKRLARAWTARAEG